MWKNNKELAQEYFDQADEIEKKIELLRKKRPRHAETEIRLRREINILEGMLLDARNTANTLLHYDEE